jgi:hypothetical protein
MKAVLWDCEGFLLFEFPPPIATVTKTLKKLHETIKRNRPGKLTSRVRLLHDGA